MPAMEQSDLHQTAIYWAYNGLDDDGQPLLAAGVEVACRWEVSDAQPPDPDSDAIHKPAPVVVDRDMAIGSELWPGTDYEYSQASSPTRWRVVGFKKTPDVKGVEYRRVAYIRALGTQSPNLG